MLAAALPTFVPTADETLTPASSQTAQGQTHGVLHHSPETLKHAVRTGEGPNMGAHPGVGRAWEAIKEDSQPEATSALQCLPGFHHPPPHFATPSSNLLAPGQRPRGPGEFDDTRDVELAEEIESKPGGCGGRAERQRDLCCWVRRESWCWALRQKQPWLMALGWDTGCNAPLLPVLH